MDKPGKEYDWRDDSSFGKNPGQGKRGCGRWRDGHQQSHGIDGRFRHQGLRMTLPRQLIIKVLSEASEYVTAEEIFMAIHNEYPGIGMATVYRTLILLANMGIVLKFEFGEGKARYKLAEDEKATANHHLLICTNCFKVVKYTDSTKEELKMLENLDNELKDRYGYSIKRHVVQFFGLCDECSKSSEIS